MPNYIVEKMMILTNSFKKVKAATKLETALGLQTMRPEGKSSAK